MQSFPKNQFESALKEPKKVRTQLAKFIKEYQAQNYHWIFQSLTILHQIITSGSQVQVNKKLGGAFALKVLFDTAEFAIINWIQTFFLPGLYNIVSNCIKDGQASEYFVKIGYDKNIPDLTKYSFSFTKILAELIQVAALVKPHRLYEVQQLQQQSQYVKALTKLTQKGFKTSEKMSFFKQDAIKKVIQQFQVKLQNFNSQLYQEFFQQKMQEYLANGKAKRGLDILKVYQSGDLCVTSSAIQICKEALIKCNNIKQMRNALILLDDLMTCADYQTFYSLNNQNGLGVVLRDIFENKSGDFSIHRGRNLFKNAGQSSQQKQKFYVLFLECLQRWSQFYPTDANGKTSVLKSFYNELKSKLQYPQNKHLKQDKESFNKNKKQNSERNKKLASQIQHQSPELNTTLFKFVTAKALLEGITKQQSEKNKKQIVSEATIQQPNKATQSKKEIQKQDTSKKQKQSEKSLPFQSRQKQTPHQAQPKMKNNEEFSYLGIKKTIAFARQTLANLDKQPDQYQTNLAILKQFSTTIDDKLQNAQIQDEDQFNQITEEAFKLSDQVNRALQISKKYQNKNQNFLRFSQQLQSKVVKEKAPKSKVEIADPSIQLKKKEDNSLTLNDKNDKNRVQYTRQMIEQARSNPKIQHKKEQQDTPVKRIRIDNQQDNSEINKSRQKFDESSMLESIKNQGKFSSSKIQQIKPQFILSQKQPQNHPIQGQNQLSHHSIRKTQKNEHMSQSKKSYKKIQNVQGRELYNSIEDSRGKGFQHNFGENNYKKHAYDFQNIAPLQQDVQSNVSAHKPKQFKSLGQYKFQPQSKIPGKSIIKTQKPNVPADHQLGLSNARSSYEKSSVHQYSPDRYQNFQREVEHSSKMRNSNASNHLNIQQQYNQQLLQDQMHVPDYQPLEQSFHDLSQIQERVKKNPVPSFKKCFEADKYVLPQDKKAKVYWLQNDTSNLLRPVSRKERLKSSKISVPQILQQRNKKYQAEMRQLQEQKNQKIKQLQSKVKNLQTQTVSMKHKITVQDQEIRSMRSNSQYDKQSQGKRNYISDQENIILNKFSLGTPSKMMTPQNKHFFDQSKAKSMFLDPTGKLISSKNYKTYFNQFIHQKQKKALLKNKQLLQKDKYIQIGSMGRRQGQNLILIFYVTPQKDLQGLTWTIESPGLSISCQPNQVPFIKGKKQQKIYLTIRIDQIPFKLPSITFYYKIQDQFLSQNIHVPCGFHKFVHLKEQEDDTFKRYFSNSEQIIRGEQVPYSKRILKNYDVLKQYFPNMSLLNKGQPNTQGQISYGGLASYRGTNFPVKISVKPNQFLYVQSILQDKGLHNQNMVQFYICLLTNLLMKQIQI